MLCKAFTIASLVLAGLAVSTEHGAAQTALSGEPVRIQRATGPIVIDGDVSDGAWRQASRVEKWYETNPGDNVPPVVRSVAYLTFDEDRKGTLEPSKLADLAVLSADPLTVEETRIADITSLMTMVGGKIVHEAANWSQ